MKVKYNSLKGKPHHIVVSKLDFTTAEPTTPQKDEIYFNLVAGASNVTSTAVSANTLCRWMGDVWEETPINEGETLFDKSMDTAEVWDGTQFQPIGGGGVETTVIDASASAQSIALGTSDFNSGIGSVLNYTNGDMTNGATFTVDSGQTLNGDVDGTFDAGQYGKDAEFLVTNVSGGFVVTHLFNSGVESDLEVIIDEQSLVSGGVLTTPADLSAYQYLRFEADGVYQGGGGTQRFPFSNRIKVSALQATSEVILFSDGTNVATFFRSGNNWQLSTGTFDNIASTYRVVGIKKPKEVVAADQLEVTPAQKFKSNANNISNPVFGSTVYTAFPVANAEYDEGGVFDGAKFVSKRAGTWLFSAGTRLEAGTVPADECFIEIRKNGSLVFPRIPISSGGAGDNTDVYYGSGSVEVEVAVGDEVQAFAYHNAPSDMTMASWATTFSGYELNTGTVINSNDAALPTSFVDHGLWNGVDIRTLGNGVVRGNGTGTSNPSVLPTGNFTGVLKITKIGDWIQWDFEDSGVWHWRQSFDGGITWSDWITK